MYIKDRWRLQRWVFSWNRFDTKAYQHHHQLVDPEMLESWHRGEQHCREQENSQSLPEVVEVVKYMKYNLGVFYII